MFMLMLASLVRTGLKRYRNYAKVINLSPVLTGDASISINISIRVKIAYALVRTAMT